MKAITLRNIPPDVARALQRRARESGKSYNQTVLALLTEALGLLPGAKQRVRHADLDHLIGSWSAARARELDASIAAQRRTDEELWT